MSHFLKFFSLSPPSAKSTITNQQSNTSNAPKNMKLADHIILLYILKRRAASEAYVHSRNRKRFYKMLSQEQKRRRQKRIPRVSLLLPHQSSWRKLYTSRNDQALITFTGLDVNAFDALLTRFAPVFDVFTPYKSSDGFYFIKNDLNKGRKRLIDARDCLGLLLAWTRTRGSQMVLQMLFGMTGTCVSDYIQFGIKILVQVLQELEEAKVYIPTIDYVNSMKALVRNKHPLLENVWCTMDGLKLFIEVSSNDDDQNNYYNGWTHDHYVNAVLCFSPDGTIRVSCYNVPGSVHDSTVASIGGIYEKLKVWYQRCQGQCTVDSAFARKKYPFLIKSGKKNLELNRNEREIRKQATSMRQSAEWGMRCFQSSFPRVKDRIKWEEYGRRKSMLKMMILLYNFRTNMVGINQILNFYKDHLERDANQMFMG